MRQRLFQIGADERGKTGRLPRLQERGSLFKEARAKLLGRLGGDAFQRLNQAIRQVFA